MLGCKTGLFNIAAAAGYLLPTFANHSFYWMGLTTNSWPTFKWLDVTMAPLTPLSYNHWGRMENGMREPYQVCCRASGCGIGNPAAGADSLEV